MPYKVVFVGPDVVIVDYGKTLGMHPIPNFDVKINDMVVVDKTSTIWPGPEKDRGQGIAD